MKKFDVKCAHCGAEHLVTANATKVGDMMVPVLAPKGQTEVTFSAGARGKREAGVYCFWTAYGKDSKGPWQITGRAKKSLPPGDRFDRMDRERKSAESAGDRAVYSRMWKMLKTVRYIKPSTDRAVADWIASHKSDAEFASSDCVIEGRKKKRLPKL